MGFDFQEIGNVAGSTDFVSFSDEEFTQKCNEFREEIRRKSQILSLEDSFLEQATDSSTSHLQEIDVQDSLEHEWSPLYFNSALVVPKEHPCQEPDIQFRVCGMDLGHIDNLKLKAVLSSNRKNHHDFTDNVRPYYKETQQGRVGSLRVSLEKGWPQPDTVDVAIEATKRETGEIVNVCHNKLQLEFIDFNAFYSLMTSLSTTNYARMPPSDAPLSDSRSLEAGETGIVSGRELTAHRLKEPTRQPTGLSGWQGTDCYIWMSIDKVKRRLNELHVQNTRKDIQQWMNSCLWCAARYSQFAVCEYLVKQGGDPTWRYELSGNTAIHLAVQWNRSDILQLLMDGGWSLDVSDVYGLTPLWWGGYYDHKDCVEILLSRGADPLNKRIQSENNYPFPFVNGISGDDSPLAAATKKNCGDIVTMMQQAMKGQESKEDVSKQNVASITISNAAEKLDSQELAEDLGGVRLRSVDWISLNRVVIESTSALLTGEIIILSTGQSTAHRRESTTLQAEDDSIQECNFDHRLEYYDGDDWHERTTVEEEGLKLEPRLACFDEWCIDDPKDMRFSDVRIPFRVTDCEIDERKRCLDILPNPPKLFDPCELSKKVEEWPRVRKFNRKKLTVPVSLRLLSDRRKRGEGEHKVWVDAQVICSTKTSNCTPGAFSCSLLQHETSTNPLIQSQLLACDGERSVSESFCVLNDTMPVYLLNVVDQQVMPNISKLLMAYRECLATYSEEETKEANEEGSTALLTPGAMLSEVRDDLTVSGIDSPSSRTLGIFRIVSLPKIGIIEDELSDHSA